MIAADPLAPRVPVPDAPPARWGDHALPLVTAAVHEAGHLVIADLAGIRVDGAYIDPAGNGGVFADLDGADPRDFALFAAGGTAAQLVFGLGGAGAKGDAEPVVIDLTTDRLVPTSEAARLTGLSAKRLRDYRCDRTGPAFLKMGTSEQARCLYRLSDLERWIQENARPMGG